MKSNLMNKAHHIVLGTFLISGLVPSSSYAGLANDTLSLCQNGGRLDELLVEQVAAIGWQPFAQSDSVSFSDVFFDAALITLSGGPFDPIDWGQAKVGTAELTQNVLDGWSSGGSFSLFASDQSFLFIADNSDEQVDQIRCVYAGDSDAHTLELSTAVLEMDKLAGIPRISDIFYRMSSTSKRQLDDGSGKLGFISDTLIAHYTGSAQSVLGRETTAELGFSVIASRVR